MKKAQADRIFKDLDTACRDGIYTRREHYTLMEHLNVIRSLLEKAVESNQGEVTNDTSKPSGDKNDSELDRGNSKDTKPAK